MTPSELAPPPTYSQQDPDAPNSGSRGDPFSEPQLLIVPTVDVLNFQKGYLGAEGEHAAIEGELQIKGWDTAPWSSVSVSLRTIESAYGCDIELNSYEVVLFPSSSSASGSSLPSTLHFSIPLTPDAPQSLQTPQSSLSHVLTATLHRADGLPPFPKSILVQTRRFVSHSYVPAIHPETHTLDDPTRVEVQVPRTTFIAGEAIPVYVSVPSPTRELVLERGLRLRNVKAELVQSVKVRRPEQESPDVLEPEWDLLAGNEELYEVHPSISDSPSMSLASASGEKFSTVASSSRRSTTPPFLGASYRTVVAHSGSLCRFHSSRPVRLRFILNQAVPSSSPSGHCTNLPNAEYTQLEGDVHFTPITQATLLHSVSFRLYVHVSFVDMSAHTERISTISIPVIILAPPAPLPQVDESLDIAYLKKHDRPPVKTYRYDDAESSAPPFEEGEAGPSFLNSMPPPPFEEPEAPPPFSSHSFCLPTFLESEAEIIVPEGGPAHSLMQTPQPMPIEGEGPLFGFPASEQFDGHSEEENLSRAVTPPPTLEMAERDTDVTDLARGEHGLEALSITLDGREEIGEEQQPPPPPPAMDDPLDPPPSIDSEYRSPRTLPRSPSPHTSASSPLLSTSAQTPVSSVNGPINDGYAPPPYLHHDGDGDHEHVARPPPYMDLIPSEPT